VDGAGGEPVRVHHLAAAKKDGTKLVMLTAYDAVTAERWGVVNEAVPHAELEERALEYAATVAGKSPQAIRMLKLAFNLADDGPAGQQVLAGLKQGHGHLHAPLGLGCREGAAEAHRLVGRQ